MAKSKMASHHGTSEHEGAAWGKGEFANMPSEVKMQKYPKCNEAAHGNLDDTMSEIDDTTRRAHGDTRRFMSNQH